MGISRGVGGIQEIEVGYEETRRDDDEEDKKDSSE